MSIFKLGFLFLAAVAVFSTASIVKAVGQSLTTDKNAQCDYTRNLEKTRKTAALFLLCISAFVGAVSAEMPADVLTLETAITQAKQNDPWLMGNKQDQLAMEYEAVAAGYLPNPTMSLGFANLPTDTFDFSQDPMTQFQVGISQMFPRGDTLKIRREKLNLISQQFPFQRENRLAKIEVIISQLWLDAYKAQESIALVEANRALFEQLADTVQARYAASVGRTRQQDIVRTQLELSRLEDRLSLLHQQLGVAESRLMEWIGSVFVETTVAHKPMDFAEISFPIDSVLPDISLYNPALVLSTEVASQQTLALYFIDHPLLKAQGQQIKAGDAEVELAEQKYRPEWGVNAKYGYRDAEPMGRDLSNFFSVSINFDVPLFTRNRQNKHLAAAVSSAESKKSEKWLLLRSMIAGYETSKVRLQGLNQRMALYQEQLLPQMDEQADASLTAYTNDYGDFADVIRSEIATLNMKIDALGIAVERQKVIAQINYFFAASKENFNERGGMQ